jgi:hypothetical protein
MKTLHIGLALAVAAIFGAVGTQAFADPLPGEVLKFQQLPLNNGLAPSVGGQQFPGHDEWSTALLSTAAPTSYQGVFMADDFADKFSTPVVHVKWWGSYDQNITGVNGVQQFLVSFESDVPVSTANPFSHPGTPLLSEIVRAGPLAPASGTFTEQLIKGAVQEHLYQYNAELAVPFAEQPDTVYWLKIVALVNPPTDGPIKWGWHDRDWGIKDTLASAPPAVSPGEHIEGTVLNSAGTLDPVWHFQDDAVMGQITATPNAAGGFTLSETAMTPQNYIQIAGAVPIDGPPGIQQFSKDLAFELYTTPVPEPSTIVLFGLGGLGLVRLYRRSRKTA